MYEHKGMGEGIGPARAGPLAGGFGPEVEYGALHPIEYVNGKAFRPGDGEVETKALGPTAAGGVPQTEWLPDMETATWVALPEEVVSPATRRAAEIAVEAARLELKGLPDPLTVRYMLPLDPSTYRIYTDILGHPPATFTNVPRTDGTFFPTRPREVWVSVKGHAGDVARYAVHECVHCWRHTTGAPPDMSQADQEQEAEAVADKLLPLVFKVAELEGGLR